MQVRYFYFYFRIHDVCDEAPHPPNTCSQLPLEARHGAALNDHIYMDAMGFGMGCCCLQLTFQCCNIDDARRMYDALIPIGPIMLALTAASPLWRGYIADVDCRWNVIAGSVDDRTEEERGLKVRVLCYAFPAWRAYPVISKISPLKITECEFLNLGMIAWICTSPRVG